MLESKIVLPGILVIYAMAAMLVFVGVMLLLVMRMLLLAPVAQQLTLHRLGWIPIGVRQFRREQILLILRLVLGEAVISLH